MWDLSHQEQFDFTRNASDFSNFRVKSQIYEYECVYINIYIVL